MAVMVSKSNLIPLLYMMRTLSHPMAAGSCTLCSCGKPTDVSDANFGLYLGNLRDGTSELLVPLHSDDTIGYIEGWSSDNVHFIFSDANYRLYLGDINGEITHIDVRQGVELSGWID